MHVGMKLALSRCLQDHLVGEIAISDYLLWWLNKHEMFGYVDYMSIEEPVDDIKVMLAQSAVNTGCFQKKKDLADNTIKMYPNLTRTADKFLAGFRSGKYGLINLDEDQVLQLCNRQTSSNRG